MRHSGPLLLALLLPVAADMAVSPLAAQTARDAPSARLHTTADFSWLAGTWAGQFPGTNAVALELTFQSPKAGLMSGIMRLSQNGKPVLIELMSVLDTPHGVVFRVRHFDDSLTAKETTFRQAMVLTRSTDSSDTFENQVPFDRALMSTEPRVATWTRHGADAMTAHNDIIDAQGKASTIDVEYRRVSAP